MPKYKTFSFSKGQDRVTAANLHEALIDAQSFSAGNNIRLALYFVWLVKNGRLTSKQASNYTYQPLDMGIGEEQWNAVCVAYRSIPEHNLRKQTNEEIQEIIAKGLRNANDVLVQYFHPEAQWDLPEEFDKFKEKYEHFFPDSY